jgi:hypothetical protein
LRRAEFGFFGVVVYTRTQTPRRCGHDLRAGEAVLKRAASRPDRMSWLMVGMFVESADPGGSRSVRVAWSLRDAEDTRTKVPVKTEDRQARPGRDNAPSSYEEDAGHWRTGRSFL